MFKGKYVLISISELQRKLSDYLNIECNLKKSNDCSSNMLLEIKKADIISNDIKTFLGKIVGPAEHFIEDLIFDLDSKDNLLFDMTECTFVLRKVLEINEKVAFDDEVVLTNEDKDVYLFYVDLN